MTVVKNKIDFVGIVSVQNANPNGDPLNGNRPRITDRGHGEISDVALKRKIRNRWMEMGESVFVQSDDNRVDDFTSLRERADSNEELKEAGKDREKYIDAACSEWLDVRAFGQLFAFKGTGKGSGVSVGIRGPVTIQSAFSVDPVDIESIQITKSVNTEPGDKKGSDTMGMKHRVAFGVYMIKGSINVQLAERTGFSDEDALKLQEALRTLFANDASSARPEGSMDLKYLYWFEHNSKLGQYPPASVHNSIKVTLKDDIDLPTSFDDYDIKIEELDGLKPKIFSGYEEV
ncbi:MAG: type I-C CRISPR-associated protein Cas7/Csd2 [Fastidiosipila sp.]|nr:type I-C CRISPR-associated protein Cas7/Csd2 [Fastidiosipila sp.]